jgi:hypothetical protein
MYEQLPVARARRDVLIKLGIMAQYTSASCHRHGCCYDHQRTCSYLQLGELLCAHLKAGHADELEGQQ